MARMLSKTHDVWVSRRLPGGSYIGGLPVPERQARRIKRAREVEQLRRSLRSKQRIERDL
jgi:hypothetical protein